MLGVLAQILGKMQEKLGILGAPAVVDVFAISGEEKRKHAQLSGTLCSHLVPKVTSHSRGCFARDARRAGGVDCTTHH